jgi:hypothetical protein
LIFKKPPRDRISFPKQTLITFFKHFCSRVLKRTGKMVKDIQTVSFPFYNFIDFFSKIHKESF